VKLRRKSTNKKVKNALPLTYNDIRFKSKLEVYAYKALKENNLEANYEPVRFTIIEPFQYKDEKVRAMTYTPDFVGDDFVIECKGFANDAFPLRWKIFKHFLFLTNSNYDLYLLRNKKEIDEAILTILKKRKENGKLS